MLPIDQSLACTVDRFESGQVVLEFAGGQFLTIARRFLPKGVKEGDRLVVEMLTDRLAIKRRENIARAVLEEILNGD